jgi:tryptophan-rich hypothetical protein
MNRLNPEKLRLSKWTAAQPVNKEKHFLVTEVQRDTDERVCTCLLEAVLSKREQLIDWRELCDAEKWLQGWQ